MTDIIITSPIKVRDLISELHENFDMDDVVKTGLWIRKEFVKPNGNKNKQ